MQDIQQEFVRICTAVFRKRRETITFIIRFQIISISNFGSRPTNSGEGIIRLHRPQNSTGTHSLNPRTDEKQNRYGGN